MEHLNELSAPCATITGHRPSRLDDEAPAAAPRPRTGSLPIIPAQFFNREPHRFLPVAFLAISPPFDQSLLPFLGSCHEDLVELMLDPRINPEAADQLFGPSDAGPSDAEAADRPFGPSKADKTRPAQPLRGVPLPSIILPSIRIPAALPCLVFIVGVQSTKPFPASDCFKKGCFCWATGTKPTDPALPLRLLDGRVLTSSGATVIRRLAPRPVARQIAARGRLCAGRGWSRPGTA